MTITIYGSGAIGGTVGAFVANAGEDVLFVDKAVEHVDAMNSTGLRISGSKSLQIPARAVFPKSLKGPLGLLFLAVKSQDYGSRARHDHAARRPRHGGRVLQNGMNPPAEHRA